MMTMKDNFISEFDEFNVDHGFSIAFGLINDEMDLGELTPDIGKIELVALEWGFREDNEYYYEEHKIKTHICSEEELGLTGNSSAFYPTIETAQEELKSMVGTFICMDREELHINGHYNSDNARMMYIFLKKCMNETAEDEAAVGEKVTCASDEAIRDYFAGTYVNLMSNRKRFDFRNFGEEALIKESTLVWTAVQTQVQTEMPFKVIRTDV